MGYERRPPPFKGLLLVTLIGQLCVLHPRPCGATSEAIIPLAQLATSALASGSFTDLSSLGGPAFAMDSALLSWLQQALLEVFNMDDSRLAGLLQGQTRSTGSTAAGLASLTGAAAGATGGFAAGAAAGAVGGFVAGAPVGSAVAGGPPMLPPLPPSHPLAPWAKSHDLALRVLADKWASALVKAQFQPGLQGFLQLLGLTQLQEALVHWVCIIYPWQVEVAMPQLVRDVRDAYCVRALPAAAVSKITAGPPKPGKPGLLGPGPLPVGPDGVLG